MKNVNHIVEFINQSQHHMLALLSLLVGLVALKKKSSLFDDDEIIGDNIPATLLDELMP